MFWHIDKAEKQETGFHFGAMRTPCGKAVTQLLNRPENHQASSEKSMEGRNMETRDTAGVHTADPLTGTSSGSDFYI